MKKITKLMINQYKIKQLGYDFMGYKLEKGDIYTFHHLIVPARHGGKIEVSNGAVLCGKTSHPYLHLIECKDLDMFCFITSEMVDENIKGYLDLYNIKCIYEVLEQFEREHCADKDKHGHYLIKEEYTRRPKL